MVNSGSSRRSNLSQERSQRNRAALLDAAEELWSEDGFDAVKVEDICDRAGVSKGLFYFYFGSKEDLLVELILVDAEQVATAVDRGIEAGESTEAILQKALAVMVRRAQRRPQHLLARGIAEWFGAPESHTATSVGHARLQDCLRLLFEHGQEREEIGDEHSSSEIGNLLAWSLMRATLEWAISGSRQPSLIKRLWSASEILLRGAAT